MGLEGLGQIFFFFYIKNDTAAPFGFMRSHGYHTVSFVATYSTLPLCENTMLSEYSPEARLGFCFLYLLNNSFAYVFTQTRFYFVCGDKSEPEMSPVVSLQLLYSDLVLFSDLSDITLLWLFPEVTFFLRLRNSCCIFCM